METTPQHFTPEKPHSDHFTIDDLLNLPSDDPFDVAAASTDSSAITTTATVDSCNSPAGVARRTLTDTTQFSHDLCVPYDDMAELEWLSNFVEESFSSEDMEKLQLLSGVKSRPVEESETHPFDHDNANRTDNSMFSTDKTVPAKARTKRSRAAPSNWTSRLIGLSQTSMGPAATVSLESETDITSSLAGKKTVKTTTKKKEIFDKNEPHNGEGRKCYHCATDKTPQWRTGPLGPKTLCNACGVRYKSGRLVPEYRPAASPTFVLTKHSNSHRKVLELRRQKEMQSAHQQPFLYHQNMMFDVPKGDEYLIHQHVGLDYRQLI